MNLVWQMLKLRNSLNKDVKIDEKEQYKLF